MDSAPLIAKCAKPCINEAHSLCREVFAKNYKKHYNIENLNNLVDYHSESDDVKLCALAVNQVHLKTKITMKQIEEVEEQIALRKSDFFLSKECIEKSEMIKERVRLKSWQAITDLPQEIVNKYNLLQRNDILPNKLLQSFDFMPEDSKPHKPGPCCVESDVHIVSSHQHKHKSNTACVLPEIIKSLPSKSGEIAEVFQSNFRILPESYVVFYNYEKHILYKRIIHIQNASEKHSNSLLLIESPITRYFSITPCDTADGDNTKVAPGLSVRYYISFQPDCYLNIIDRAVFRTTNCNSNLSTDKQYDTLTVQLCSYRESPVLRGTYTVSSFVFNHNFSVPQQTFLCEGLMVKASLNLDDFTLYYPNFSKIRSQALSETIDCGSCFQGSISTSHLILRNYGSSATFALITEMEWFYSHITNVSVHNELILPSFVISPAYFKLDFGEYIDISINFTPNIFGLYCENLYLFSDNNSTEQLDLIADGIIFNRNIIEIECVDFEDLLKCPGDDLSNPDVRLNFGMCLFEQTLTKQITLTNKSCMQLNYRFVTEECNEIECRIPNDWVTITSSGLLSSFGSTQVGVELNAGYSNIGGHMVKLIISRVTHVQCHIRFQTSGIQTVQCKWIVPITSCICIEPIQFELIPINDIVPDDNFLDCYFLVNEENLKADYQLCTLVINGKQNLIFELNLRQGIVPAHTPDCSVLNLLQVNITNEEDVHDSNMTCKMRFKLKMLYAPPNILNDDETDDVSIGKDFYNDSIAPVGDQQTAENISPVTLEEKYHIHGTHSCFNIIYVPQLLYIEQVWRYTALLYDGEMTYSLELGLMGLYGDLYCIIIETDPSVLTPKPTRVCLHNNLNARVKYLWTFLSGKQRNMLDIQIVPEKGVLAPLSRTRFDVYIRAKVVGIIEELFINCYLGGDLDKLQIRVMCATEDFSCKITLPDDDSTAIFWPPIENELQHMCSSIPMDLMLLNEPNEMESLHHIEDDMASIQSEESGSHSEYLNAVPPPSLITEESVVVEASTYGFTNEIIRLIDKFSLCTSDMALASDGDVSCKSVHFSNLRENFDENDLMVQEYVIEFKEVPTRILAKKTITIENLTPLLTIVKTEVINFPALHVDESKLDKVLTDIGYKKNTFWDKQLGSHGVLIKPVQNKRVIQLAEKLEIDIYVYGDTFGVYADELLVEINEVVPFCVTILVEIVGCPIEFPMALNTIQPCPILRFGNIHYKARPIERNLRLYNSSSIPISILWHILLQDKSHKKEEFTALFDLHGKNEPLIEDSEDVSVTGDITITRRYYGTPTQSAFQIFPTESVINPKSFMDLKVTFYSETYSGQFTNLNLEAYLLGYIYMNQCYISQSFLYIRPYGKHLSPVKVLLTSTLELPILKLNSIAHENRFKFYATEVFANGGSSQIRNLLFKNSQSTTAKVRMKADPPFTIVLLKTRKFEASDKDFIAVEPNEVLQVTVRCDLILDKLKEMARVHFCNMEYSEDLTSLVIKWLHIEQRATMQQQFPLNILVIFPQFQLSTLLLEFGYCLLEVEKMKLVSLVNPIGCKVPFTIEVPDDIYVLPTSGFVPPCTGAGKGSIDIKVFFVPRVTGLFKGKVKFCTNLSDYAKTLEIFAVGSCDTMYK